MYYLAMRQLLAIIAALFFLLHTSMVAATPVHACCPDADCPMIQCVAAGCLPAVFPAPGSTPFGIALAVVREKPAVDIAMPMPSPVRAIWRPPD